MNSRILISLIFLCLTGCWMQTSTMTLTSNGISYEMPFQKQAAPSPGVERSTDDKTPHTDFMFIGESVTIKESDGKLTINGKDFGTVKAGDKVRITKANEISVNGSPRTPK